MSPGGLVLVLFFSFIGVARAESLVQEEHDVTIDGHVERWRLEWQAAPRPFCDQKADARDIRCRGFIHGLSGSLDLVRLVGAQEVDRLPLTPLFRYGIWGDENGPKEARFQP